mmetsp:Transcript_148599/g.413999  ORF Transcript_148599/g.413999 Transcript_148599/m.413999 type:complete len:537 (-) Transcript_148599:99-1709(-)
MEAVIFNTPHLPDALRQALNYAGDDGFVASLPQLLHARVNASYDNEIWNDWFTANSEENVVKSTDGRHLVVAVHGGGILSLPDRIEKMYRAESGGMTADRGGKITNDEARGLLEGKLPDATQIPIYTFEEFKRGVDKLPQRYAVIMDLNLAKQSRNGYTEFGDLEDDPLMIVRAGGVEPLAAYLDKARKRRNTMKMGAWHPYASVDPEQPQSRVIFLAGSPGGVGSEGDSDLQGYDVDYGIGGDANIHNRGRYIGVAPQSASTSLCSLPFGPADMEADGTADTKMEANIVFETHLARALQEALTLAGDHGFVASIPQLIHARVRAPFDNDVWKHKFTANSEESVLQTSDGRCVVVTVHGGGILGSPGRIVRAFQTGSSGITGQYAAKLSEQEACDLLEGKLPDGTRIPVFPFDDFRRGIANLPSRYAVATELNVARESKRGYEHIDSLMEDPLMIVHAGGIEQLAAYLGKLRGRQNSFGTWHPFNFTGFDPTQPQTRVLFLSDDGDILAGNGLVNMGRYVAITPRNGVTSLRHLRF